MSTNPRFGPREEEFDAPNYGARCFWRTIDGLVGESLVWKAAVSIDKLFLPDGTRSRATHRTECDNAGQRWCSRAAFSWPLITYTLAVVAAVCGLLYSCELNKRCRPHLKRTNKSYRVDGIHGQDGYEVVPGSGWN